MKDKKQKKKKETANEKLLPGAKSFPPLSTGNISNPTVGFQASPNYKLQTSNMEVHHQPHVHHSKKWKDYLFEFLMLFLAVTLGFFVENQREHYIEQQREKQFISSLVNDIISDTARISSIIDTRLSRERRLDSLSFLMNNNTSTVHTSVIYFYAITPARSLSFRFVPNDGTMQQLKNSGALRLIRTRTAVDSIAKYDVSVRNLLRQGEIEDDLIQDYRVASAKIFNAIEFDKMLDKDNNVIRHSGTPALLPYTKEDLHTWNYKMYSMKALNKAMRRDARLLLRQAKNLLFILKEKYDIK